MAEHALQQRHVGTGVLAGTSMVEALAGLGAIVLAIIGLAGGVPVLAMNIATIVAGVALWFEGGSLAARYERAHTFAYEGGADVAGGMSAEMMAGLTGVVLGILALIGINPGVLVAAALTTYGGGLLIGAGANARAAVPATSTSTFATQPTYDTTTGTTTVRPQVYTRESETLPQALGAAAGGQLMVGIGASVLGILALVGIAPATLSLVGMLAIGASILLTGTAAGAALFGARRSSHV